MNDIDRIKMAYKVVWEEVSEEDMILFIQLLMVDKELQNLYYTEILLKRFNPVISASTNEKKNSL